MRSPRLSIFHSPWLRLGHAALLLTVGLFACASPGPAGRRAARPVLPKYVLPPRSVGLSAEDLTQGAKLHTAKCARCHQFYDPAAYTDPEWLSWMTKMSKKARLNLDQQALLSRYLGAFRAP